MKRFIKKPIVFISFLFFALLVSALQFTPPETIYKIFIQPADASNITNLSGSTGYVGKEDIRWGTGLDTDTYTVPTYSTGTVTLTKLPSLFANAASIIKGKWYVAAMAGDHGNAALTGSLAWVINTLSANPANIDLPGNQTYSLTTNLAIPETIVLNFQRGAILGGTGNISGDGLKHIQAGAWQIFSTSGTITFPDGSDLKSSWFASFETAITKISTAKVSLEITKADTIANDTTVNANTALKSTGPGKVLTIASGKTLTINGPYQTSGLYQTFSLPGSITFASGAVSEVYPQWWGALGNGVQDERTYIQAAADSITTGTLRLVGGEYALNSMASYTSANGGSENGIIIINNPISIKGDGMSTKLKVTLDSTFYAAITLNGVNGTTIEGLYIYGTGTAASVPNYGGGIRVLLSGRTTIKNNVFENLRGIAINYVGNLLTTVGNTGVDYYCAYNIADGNIIRNTNGDGIYHIYSKYAVVTNNILYKTGYTDAIIFEACDHGVITNNIILEPNERSILVNTGSSYTTVAHNTIYHYDATTVSNSILLASVRYCDVSDNVIRYAAAGGIPQSAITMIPGIYDYVDTYHNITNNQIINAGNSTTTTAIHVQTDYNNIQGNKISGGTYGISVDDADYNVIRGNDIRDTGTNIILAGIDARPDPTYTYVIDNFVLNSILDYGTNNYIRGTVPDTETLTEAFEIVSRHLDSATIDSSGNAVGAILGPGYYVGQIKTIVMTDATNSSTVTVNNHVTSDPEVATFDAVGETWTLIWLGTEWGTLGTPTCTFL